MKAKKIFICILFLLVCVLAQDIYSQVTIKLHPPPPNRLASRDLWKMIVHNQGNPVEIHLEGYVDEQTSGKRIVDATSETFALDGNERKTYYFEDFRSRGSVTWNDNEYENAIIRTGVVPAGIYNICITPYGGATDNITNVGKTTCIIHTINRPPEIGITLIAPVNESFRENNPIMFSWTGANLTASENYKLSIKEISSNQSCEEAFQNNRTIFERKNIKTITFPYPPSAQALTPRKKYTWKIALIKNNEIVKESECGEFEITSPEVTSTVQIQNVCSYLSVNVKKDAVATGQSCYRIRITNNIPTALKDSNPYTFQIRTFAQTCCANTIATGFIQSVSSVSPKVYNIAWRTENGISKGSKDIATICLDVGYQPYLVYEWLNKKGKVLCTDSLLITDAIIGK